MLRAAIDISFLAQLVRRRESVAGISRAIHELLPVLVAQPDLELAIVGICAPDPVRGGSLAAAYAKRSSGRYAFDRGFRSTVGADRLYDGLALSIGANEKAGSRLKSIAARACLKAFKVLDARTTFDGDRYDVIHSTFLPLPPPAVTASAARVLTLYDVIPLEHPTYVTDAQRWLAEQLIAGLGSKDWVIVPSSYVRDRVCERATVDRDRVVVVPLGVSDRMRPVDRAVQRAATRRYGIGETPYVLCLAARQPRKNLALVIRAFERLVDDDPSRPLALVLAGGAGWRTEDTDAALRERSHLRPRIIETGFVADADLPALYSAAEVFAFPSRAEGFGLPLLEAMRCGTPVVAARASSVPDLVADAAVLVDPDDVDGFAAALDRLLTDERARDDLRRRGDALSREFTWRRCAEGTAATYRRAAATP